MLPLTLSIYALGTPLTHLYTTDPVAVEASVLVALFSLLGTPMATGTVIYGSLGGLGMLASFYATSIGMWCIRIGTAYLMGIVLGWGLPGIWAGTLLDNGFDGYFLRYRYQSYMSLKDRKWKKQLYLGFRWNLIGLYEAILSGIEETFGQFSIPYDKEKVREFILKFSVARFTGAGGRRAKTGCGSAQSGACPSLAWEECPDSFDARCAWSVGLGEMKQGLCSLFIPIKETCLYHSKDLGLECYFTEF